ncbi:MAG: hypothetical protein Q2484_17190 [Candidatus Sedimenticola sp. (ex Thyasira tokunagai)]
MKLTLIFMLLVVLSGCNPVAGERMVRVVESDAGSRVIPFTGAEAGGVRIETSAKPLTGSVMILYKGDRAAVHYESGGHE